MKEKKEVRILTELCKGCLLCVEFCPKGALKQSEKLNTHGIRPVERIPDAECTGCGSCYVMCPESAIEVLDEARNHCGHSRKP